MVALSCVIPLGLLIALVGAVLFLVNWRRRVAAAVFVAGLLITAAAVLLIVVAAITM